MADRNAVHSWDREACHRGVKKGIISFGRRSTFLSLSISLLFFTKIEGVSKIFKIKSRVKFLPLLLRYDSKKNERINLFSSF